MPYQVIDLGCMEYPEAWALQKRYHADITSGGKPILMLLEHPPVLTLGRKAKDGLNIVVSREYLASQNISVHHVERGGDVTYHGYGQLIAYAIFPVGRKVVDFLRLLESCVILSLQNLGIPDAQPNPGYAGVYVDSREINGRVYKQKIASFGVAVKQGVALHGIGLNITTRLEHFDLIVPCGLESTQMTSLEREYTLRGTTARQADVASAKVALKQAFDKVFSSYDWLITKKDLP